MLVTFQDYESQDLGDTSTLADPSVVDVLKSYHPRKKRGRRPKAEGLAFPAFGDERFWGGGPQK